jgi:hypothetical protein
MDEHLRKLERLAAAGGYEERERLAEARARLGMATFRLQAIHRLYRCVGCGKTKNLVTNHTSGCVDHCSGDDGCSWKGISIGREYHRPGHRPFKYVGPADFTGMWLGPKRRNPDDKLRRLERIYSQDPVWDNFSALQTERIRSGLQNFYHDCDHCKYMGSYEVEEHHYDFYYHDINTAGIGLVARYGSDGGDYISVPANLITEFVQGRPWGEDTVYGKLRELAVEHDLIED